MRCALGQRKVVLSSSSSFSHTRSESLAELWWDQLRKRRKRYRGRESHRDRQTDRQGYCVLEPPSSREHQPYGMFLHQPPTAPEMCFGSLVLSIVSARRGFAANNYQNVCQVMESPPGPVVLGITSNGRVKLPRLPQAFGQGTVIPRKETCPSVFRYFF